jgi:hypothetical protein
MPTTPRRFALAQGAWRPLLALFGASSERAFVEVYPDTVTFRFGFFVEVVARSEIVDASAVTWPWWGGVGWRLGPSCIALVSARRNVVAVTLREARRTVMLFPWRYRRLLVSLEDPAGFIAALAPTVA